MAEEYVGDGLYVEIVQGEVKLTAPRHNGDHYVIMEPYVFANFIRICMQEEFLEKIIRRLVPNEKG